MQFLLKEGVVVLKRLTLEGCGGPVRADLGKGLSLIGCGGLERTDVCQVSLQRMW